MKHRESDESLRPIREYYEAGHTARETAEHFGTNKERIKRLVNSRGWTNNRFEADNLASSKRAETRIKEWLSKNGFEYVGGYTNKNCIYTAKCLTCGTTKTKYWSRNRAKYGVPICEECKKQERRRLSLIKAEELKEERKERNRIERLMMPKVDSYRLKVNKKLGVVHICKLCSKPYTVASYMADSGAKYAKDFGVCSKECAKEVARNKRRIINRLKSGDYRKRAMKHGVVYESGITLEKLVKRDGLTCKLCGEECSWDDKQWGSCGPLYPSLDHIIPMAKGGGHVWGNVQVAHVLCNSVKGDTLPELIKLEDDNVREVSA